MKLITIDDIRDIYIKTVQRGLSFIFSKATFQKIKRTKSAFNSHKIESSNWWIIPYVKQRWNKLITGDPKISYEEYLSKDFFKPHEKINFISIGSGICSHELKLAEINPHWKITCLDISNLLLEKAQKIAKNKSLDNISFLNKNITKFNLPDNHYDVIFFHASLHHFDDIKNFIPDKIKRKLKEKGKLIINEYVGSNRLQFSKNQLSAINECLKLIDKKYRLIYKTRIYKNRYYGSGLLRMIIADPSECVDSQSIIPTIHDNFKVIIEKPYGGNILMNVLKDISHHFITLDNHKKEILDKLFNCEDRYLLKNKSDFIFGIYEK